MANTMQFQKPHRVSKRNKLDTGEGMTEQAHKKECDMNYILKEYHRTGLIRHAKENEGRYDDVSSQDFQEAMFVVKTAENMFSTLPADIRKKFGNDPALFLDYVQDPSNADEMQRLGMAVGNDGIDVSGAQVNSPLPKPEPEVFVDPVPLEGSEA